MSSKIVAIAGGSGSGKTTLAKKICQIIGTQKCVILSQDHYYKDQSHHFDKDGGAVNFDHPNSLDFELLYDHLVQLKNGVSVKVPVYDFVTHSRKSSYELLTSASVIVVDGTLLFSQKNICELVDHKVFVDVPESLRYQRRLKRDVVERGRTPDGVYKQFVSQVKPMHDQFIEPTKVIADTIANDEFDVQSFCNIIVL